ncbi:MAG TPA: LLM class flavin-dependent oxidoreductase [Acidimicrobiales bacterium]
MSVDVYWTLPVAVDPQGPHRPLADGVTDLRPGRLGDIDRQVRVARAAEAAGFAGLLVPYDPDGDESFVLATALAREVPRLRLVPEVQPGFATAVYTAKLALTFQRFFADRLAWKPVLRTDDARQRAVGDTATTPAERVARADELLEVIAGVWRGAPFSYQGAWFEVEDGGFFGGTAQAHLPRRPAPVVFLDGDDPAELDLSARHADVHLFDHAAPDEITSLIERHRSVAAGYGRSVRYGVRLSVLAREDTAEAERDAVRLAERGRPGDGGRGVPGVPGVSGVPGASVVPGVPGAPGVDVVASFDDLARELGRFVAAGASVLVLSAPDPVGDAYRLGEFVLHQIDHLDHQPGAVPEEVPA